MSGARGAKAQTDPPISREVVLWRYTKSVQAELDLGVARIGRVLEDGVELRAADE
jgi:hypothetical protein